MSRRGYRSLRGRTTVAIAALLLQAAADAAWVGIALRLAVQPDWDFDMAVGDLLDGVLLAGLVIAGLAVIGWMRAAHENLRVLGARVLRFRHSSTLTAWIIPVVNLWRPYQVMREIWEESGGNDWGDRRVLQWWWALWLLRSPLHYVLNAAPSLSVVAVVMVVDCVGAYLAAFVIWRVTWFQARARVEWHPDQVAEVFA